MNYLKHLFALAATTAFIVSLSAAEPEKKPEWVTSAGLNFTLTSGNSDTVLLGADINSTKKTAENEYLLGAAGAYGENQGQKNNELGRAFGQWNHLFSDRFYGYIRGEAMHDGIAEVRYRLTGTAGAGYYLIKEARTSLAVEVGPGYVYEKLASGVNKFATVRFGERFEHKLNDTARIWQSAEFLPNLEDFTTDYLINAELGIEAALTKKLSLRSVLSDTYDSTPSAGRKNNDLKLTTGLAYKF